MRMNEARREIAAYGRRMNADRLSTGTSGNLSIYDPAEGLMASSPSGMAYDAITPEDVVVMDLEAHVVEGERKPSSEWALHTAFYRAKPRARAVVHAHSMYCTTFAILGQPLRAVHYMIGSAGTDVIPCAPYQTFGTPELAPAAGAAGGGSAPGLRGTHRRVGCGAALGRAYALACDMEFLAELQYRAMCIGTPNVLSHAQMAEVLARFQTYGQPKDETAS